MLRMKTTIFQDLGTRSKDDYELDLLPAKPTSSITK
jgi:hypothetical protein